jgi:hypothetical protein
VAAAVLGLLLSASAAAAAGEYVWGAGSAWLTDDPGFEGYWKYCITVSWDVRDFSNPAHAVSHVSVLLGLETCGETNTPGYFAFDDTVGTSDGPDSCTVYYYSEFNRAGDPTIPAPVPTIKFEPFANSCEPGVTGTAHLCFYSLAPPRSASSDPSAVWIKFGQDVASGALDGVLPSCRTTAAEPSSWGRIKALMD